MGASKQALLYHFGTKDALVEAVLARLLERANARLLSLMGALSPSLDERMDQVLGHLNAMFDEEPHAAAVLLRYLLDGGQRAAQRLETGAQPWLTFTVDLLRRGQAEGWVRRDVDAEAAAAQIGMMLLTHFALLPVQHRKRGEAAAWRERLSEQLVLAIRAMLFDG